MSNITHQDDDLLNDSLNYRVEWLMWQTAKREAEQFGIDLPEPSFVISKRHKVTST